jgi:hypothetical protein
MRNKSWLKADYKKEFLIPDEWIDYSPYHTKKTNRKNKMKSNTMKCCTKPMQKMKSNTKLKSTIKPINIGIKATKKAKK